MTGLTLTMIDLGILREAAMPEPDEVVKWFTRDQGAAERDNLMKAVHGFDKVIRMQPGSAAALFYRGWIRTNLKEYAEAVKDLKKSLSLNPDNAKAWTVLGTAKRNMKRYEESIEDFGTAIRLDPRDELAWAGRGRSKGFLRSYGEAMRDYDKAIGLRPDRADFWRQRGKLRVLLWTGKAADNPEFRESWKSAELLEEALRDLSNALRLDPEDANCRLLLGGVQWLMESHDEAGKSWEEAKSCFERQKDRSGVGKAEAQLNKLNEMRNNMGAERETRPS